MALVGMGPRHCHDADFDLVRRERSHQFWMNKNVINERVSLPLNPPQSATDFFYVAFWMGAGARIESLDAPSFRVFSQLKSHPVTNAQLFPTCRIMHRDIPDV